MYEIDATRKYDAITQADKETRIFEGKIIAMAHDFVAVGLKHVPGEIVTLIGGPKIDLTEFRKGDAVIIETNEDRVIRSIVAKG